MTSYVIMAGLPGTGKSTLARALAERVDGIVLDKDQVRAALFPGKFTDYSREQDDLCYDAILRAAAYLAAHERTRYIFLDGRTFSRGEQLQQIVNAAEAARCAWKILETICPESIAVGRLVLGSDSHLAGNRTPALYQELQASFEPIRYAHKVIDTSQALAACVHSALEYLRL